MRLGLGSWLRRGLAVLAVSIAVALVHGGGTAAAASERVPAGPYRTSLRSYDLGRETLRVQSGRVRLHTFPTRLQGEITVPVGAPGRRPVVVFLHGAHQSCEVPGGVLPNQDWPCRPGFFDVESFRGYRYAAQLLASWGFVVVSLDGNPVAPADGGVLTFPDGAPMTARTWMDLRAKIVDAHLRRLGRAHRGEIGGGVDFNVGLAGRLDLARVALVGHSRGGEGVVWAAQLPGPHRYAIRAVVALAPVDFFRRPVPDVPFALLLPACDGDVFDLQGGYFYDDVRARVRTSPLWQVVALGANHNFFNRIWEDETGFLTASPGEPPSDDPCAADRIGDTRLSRGEQEAFGAATIVPFVRVYAGGAPSSLLVPLGIGGPVPRQIAGAPVVVSYQPPSAERLDVVRPKSRRDLRRNLLGGRQSATGVAAYGLCRYEPGTIYGGFDVTGCGEAYWLQAHALAELRVAWIRGGGRIVSALPGGRDVRGFRALSVRAVLDPADGVRNELGRPRPFSLALRDAAGRTAAVAVPTRHPAVQYPVRVAVLGTVRVPLGAFRGVDLSQIVSVEIRFDRTPRGRLLLTDLSFVR